VTQDQDKNKENSTVTLSDEGEVQPQRHLRHLLSLCHSPTPDQMPDYELDEDDEEDEEDDDLGF
jgi:hypothetical protein